jgi:hypothetical protein
MTCHPAGERDYSLFQNVQAGPGVTTFRLTQRVTGFFTGGKAAKE